MKSSKFLNYLKLFVPDCRESPGKGKLDTQDARCEIGIDTFIMSVSQRIFHYDVNLSTVF